MIKIENVKKEFKSDESKEVVLKNINININKGEFVTIMGPSGGGKSTLLSIMGLLEQPTSGKVYIDGEEVNYKKEKSLDDIKSRFIIY